MHTSIYLVIKHVCCDRSVIMQNVRDGGENENCLLNLVQARSHMLKGTVPRDS